MNPVTLESWLEDFGLDQAARAAFAALAPDAALKHAIGTIVVEAVRQHVNQREDAGLRAQAGIFSELFPVVVEWDLSPAWLNRLIDCWVEISSNGHEPEWLCELAAKLCSRVSGADASEAACDAARRVVMLTVAALLRASRQAQERMRTLAAASDETTGLYRTEQAVAQMQSWIGADASRGFAVCMLRIAVGPVLLRISPGLERALKRQITARLRRTLRPQDALFSGGEWDWLMLMPNVVDHTALTAAVGRVLHLFDLPFDVFGREYRLSVHAGTALYPLGGSHADGVLRSARIALHEALRGGVHFEVFRAEMDHSAARYAQIEHGFLEALREDKLELYLQPLVDADDGVCRRAEGLLRWDHAGGQTVAPQFIVEIAEESGMRRNFSRWLLTRAVRTLAELDRRGMTVDLSINLTAHDLTDADLPDVIRQSLALWRVPAERLTIELTESAIIPDERHSVEALQALRNLGCGLAVDDFGTGYSSMAYLRQLPLTELKIDQLFVRRIGSSEQDREIVRSMLQLAHGLHLEVVAEGVEDETTAQLLREYGCHRMQGFLYGQAMPLQAFIAWQQSRTAKN